MDIHGRILEIHTLVAALALLEAIRYQEVLAVAVLKIQLALQELVEAVVVEMDKLDFLAALV
jgi:hypothetical protein